MKGLKSDLKRTLVIVVSFCVLILISFAVSEIYKDRDVVKEWRLFGIQDACPMNCDEEKVMYYTLPITDYEAPIPAQPYTPYHNFNSVKPWDQFEAVGCIHFQIAGGLSCARLDITQLPDYKLLKFVSDKDPKEVLQTIPNYDFMKAAQYHAPTDTGYYLFSYTKVGSDIVGRQNQGEDTFVIVTKNLADDQEDAPLLLGTVEMGEFSLPTSLRVSPRAAYVLVYTENAGTKTSMAVAFDTKSRVTVPIKMPENCQFVDWLDTASFLCKKVNVDNTIEFTTAYIGK